MVAQCNMQFSSNQKPIPSSEDSRSTVCDKSIGSIKIKECLREVHGPSDVPNIVAKCFNEVLHGYWNNGTKYRVLW